MKDSARYAKIVEWSDEDACYVGSAPGLILGGCHGPDEKEENSPQRRGGRREDWKILSSIAASAVIHQEESG